MLLRSLSILLLLPSLCWATPSITGVSGTISHGNSVVISGTGFSVKSPAAPVIFDDGEHANAVSTIYDDTDPNASGTTWDIQYRNDGFRSTNNPHSNGSRYIAGGHKDDKPYSGSDNVAVMVDYGESMENVFVMYYHSLDAQWPSQAYGGSGFGTSQFRGNHKWINWQNGTFIYDVPLDYREWDHAGSCSSGNMPSVNGAARCNTISANEGVDALPRSVLVGDWMHWEMRASYGASEQSYVTDGSTVYQVFDDPDPSGPTGVDAITIGGYACYQGTVTTNPTWLGPDGNGEYYTQETFSVQQYAVVGDTLSYPEGTIGSLTSSEYGWSAGGGIVFLGTDPSSHTNTYLSHNACGSVDEVDNSTHGGHDDMFRYFDDIYVDITWARVIFGNAETWANCTIREPQPPTAWSGSEITVTMNQGSLIEGDVYAYVFDSANAANSAGYFVTVSTSATMGTGSHFEGGSGFDSPGGGFTGGGSFYYEKPEVDLWQ